MTPIGFLDKLVYAYGVVSLSQETGCALSNGQCKLNGTYRFERLASIQNWTYLPLTKKVPVCVDHVRFAEFALDESHYVREIHFGRVGPIQDLNRFYLKLIQGIHILVH